MEYKLGNRTITYKITNDGYDIYLDEKPWISQHVPYIPYKDLSYEEGCKKQIEKLIAANK